MSDPARTTTPYKTALARAVMGEAVPAAQLTPITLSLGDGAYDSGTNTTRPPRDTLYNPTTTYPVTATRNGAQVTATVTVQAGATPINFNEFGVLTADGTLIVHRTIAPQVITEGISIEFRVDLLPPEGI